MIRKGPMTIAEAKAAGLLDGLNRNSGRRKRTTRKAVTGEPYHTRCCSDGCGTEFASQAAEDRHVAPGHNRFEVVL